MQKVWGNLNWLQISRLFRSPSLQIYQLSISYNSIQMFGPFQDQNQISFGKDSLSKLFMKIFWKPIGYIVFWPNHSGEKILCKIWIFCGSNFLFHLCNWGFGTNIENNAAVTQLKDLVVENYFFLEYVCIHWWKLYNCSKKFFWSVWSFFS